VGTIAIDAIIGGADSGMLPGFKSGKWESLAITQTTLLFCPRLCSGANSFQIDYAKLIHRAIVPVSYQKRTSSLYLEIAASGVGYHIICLFLP